MFIYTKAFVFEPISDQINIFVGCNQSFKKFLNPSYFEVNG